VVELVDTQDLKSCGQQWPCGFNSRLGHGFQPINQIGFFIWYNIAKTFGGRAAGDISGGLE
jgi:hypothetical protein